MNKITFQWDEQKNQINQQKHGISFEEAESVFFDDYGVQFWDEEHSQYEERFLLLGLSSRLRILIVVHCFREEDSLGVDGEITFPTSHSEPIVPLSRQ